MAIDPKNLPGTATITFADEFTSLSLWNGSAGTWATSPWYAPANGTTMTDNGDQEWYINSNYGPTSSVRPWTISSGVLSITAAKADPSIKPYINNYEYTSGMINSYYSFAQTYGYFEMSAQLPKGQGFWPAFWLLPTDGSWPPEIDIMEVLGSDTTTIIPAMHSMATGTRVPTGGPYKVADLSVGFHTFGLNWASDYITWYVDGNEILKAPTPADLHSPMYMIANLAVGGHWPGPVDSTTPFPSSFKIDYIRVYEELGGAPPSPPSPPSAPPPATPPASPPAAPPPPAPEPPTTPPPSGGSRDTSRGTRRDDRRDDRDGPDSTGTDTSRGTRRDDTRDDRDGPDRTGSDTSRGTRRDDTRDDTSTANRTDSINGDPGNDHLYGGSGVDLLTGDAGRDSFILDEALDSGVDHIADFLPIDDTIRLDNAVFTALATRKLSSGAFYSGPEAHDATDRIIHDPETGALSYDSDGTGPAAPVQLAELGNGLAVTARDFYIV